MCDFETTRDLDHVRFTVRSAYGNVNFN